MPTEEPEAAPVKLSELVVAFEFVSVSDLDEHQAYICKRSGRIIFVSESVDLEEDIDFPAAFPRRSIDQHFGLGQSLCQHASPALCELAPAREVGWTIACALDLVPWHMCQRATRTLIGIT